MVVQRLNHHWQRVIVLFVVIFALSSLVLVPRIQAQTQACPFTYTVQPGDNLYRIALASGTSFRALAAMNGIDNPNLIFVGQVLCVPNPISQVTVPGQPTPTQTASGQTASVQTTITPGAADPCLTRQARIVKVATEVYFEPSYDAHTGTRLRPGSSWLVCTNTTRTDWIPMVIGQTHPLWVPAGVFG